jgi:hypothetical protein
MGHDDDHESDNLQIQFCEMIVLQYHHCHRNIPSSAHPTTTSSNTITSMIGISELMATRVYRGAYQPASQPLTSNSTALHNALYPYDMYRAVAMR